MNLIHLQTRRVATIVVATTLVDCTMNLLWMIMNMSAPPSRQLGELLKVQFPGTCHLDLESGGTFPISLYRSDWQRVSFCL